MFLSPQYLWVGLFLHLLFVCFLCIQSEALSWASTASSACPLLGTGFTDGSDKKGLHTDTRVIHLEIHEFESYTPRKLPVKGLHKTRHPQSQGSVKRAQVDIKDMLTAWLEDSQTADWSTSIKSQQFSKTSFYHCGIKRPPYEALFGKRANIEITLSSLPQKIRQRPIQRGAYSCFDSMSDEPEEGAIHKPNDETDPIPVENPSGEN